VQSRVTVLQHCLQCQGALSGNQWSGDEIECHVCNGDYQLKVGSSAWLAIFLGLMRQP
jgi:hypothetical protein